MAIQMLIKKTLKMGLKELATIILENLSRVDEDLPKKLLSKEVIFFKGEEKLSVDSIEFICEYSAKEEK